jgi:hypothetical protein
MSWFRPKPYVANIEHLRDELHRAAGFVRAQLRRFQLTAPEAVRERFWHLPDDHLEQASADEEFSALDAFRPPDDVQALLTWVDAQRAAIDRRAKASAPGLDLRLVALKSEFDLSEIESDALLLAALPLVHSAYRRWYAVLQGDPGKIVPAAGLIVEMLCRDAADVLRVQSAFTGSGALLRNRLVTLGGNPDDPVAVSAVLVEDRTLRYLFGDDAMDERLAPAASLLPDPIQLSSLPLTDATAVRLEMLPSLRAAESADVLASLRLEFSGPDSGLAVRAFNAVAAGFERSVLVVDLAALSAGSLPWSAALDAVLREARLSRSLPIFVGIDALKDDAGSGRLSTLLERLERFPHPLAVAVESTGTLPQRRRSWVPFALPPPTLEMRERAWNAMLEETNGLADRELVARDLAAAFQLTDTQIRNAFHAASGLARRRNVFIPAIQPEDLFEACRRQSTSQLVAFATRLEPRHLGLDDVVLPEPNRRQLLELQHRIRNHSRVHGALGLGERMRLGRGITALFIGGSGTGKTMAAEALASEQRVDLFVVDISSLISKWVGETEKHLSRVFADAEKANCMLFFDEADSIFGQRGQIREGQDRWANLEVNYLLQRIEEFSGVVILATNFRQNIDDAFGRRIHVVVEFPGPDPVSRVRLWERLLPPARHRTLSAGELQEIAVRFDLSGGAIKNIAVDSSYRALAEESETVTLRHVVASTAREYQKSGRPVTRGEFGEPFFEWAMEDVISPPPVGVEGE